MIQNLYICTRKIYFKINKQTSAIKYKLTFYDKLFVPINIESRHKAAVYICEGVNTEFNNIKYFTTFNNGYNDNTRDKVLDY